jgi:hypothetical protein
VGLLPAADTAAVVQPAPPVGDPPTDQPAQTPAAVAAPRRLPSQTLVVRPATPLEAGVEYTVRVQRVRNVVGLESDVEGTVRVPPAEPAAAPAATRP